MAGLDIIGLARLGTQIGMQLAGNAKERVTLHLGHAEGTYDPETDTHTPAAGSQVQADVLPFKRKNTQTGATLQVVERETTMNTDTIMIELAQLPPGTVITETDTVTRPKTGTWEIIAVDYPAGEAMVLLDIRK